MPEQTVSPDKEPDRSSLYIDSPALSSARSVLAGEMIRLGGLVRQEVEEFLRKTPLEVDRIIIAPEDYSLERGASFQVLFVQKGIRMDPGLEDKLSDFDLYMANRFPEERLSVNTMSVPFMVDDAAFTSLAPTTHPQAMTVRLPQDLSSGEGSA